MNQVAKFEKVSYQQYEDACRKLGLTAEKGYDCLHDEWKKIVMPARATVGSAGYDFHIPYNLELRQNEWVTIPTGIRCSIIVPCWFLMCCPKSGLGFKYRLKLANTVGIVDSDYFFSDNEGHILAMISSEKPHQFAASDKFMQGIFVPFGTTVGDCADGVRNGGFGSTGAQ